VCVCVCVCVCERERERERERDVGCDEDKCIGEISGLDLMFYIFFLVKKREEGDHALLLCVPNMGFDLSGLREMCVFFLKQSGPLCACLHTQHHVIIGHFSSPIRDFQSLNFIQKCQLATLCSLRCIRKIHEAYISRPLLNFLPIFLLLLQRI